MTQSRADHLADQLSLAILRGELAPGVRLPAVRALAREHAVSASTIQRVLMLLEARGLVRTRDRSGVVVLDPQRHASLSVWPLIVAHARDAPTLGLRLLEDALATRRTLAIDVLGRVLADDPSAFKAAMLPEVTRFLDQAARTSAAARPSGATGPSGATPDALCVAEHELLRSVLVFARRPAVLGIVNGIERVVRASPELVAGLYTDPSLAVAGWTGLLSLLDHPAPLALLPVLEQALAAADVRAIRVAKQVFQAPLESP